MVSDTDMEMPSESTEEEEAPAHAEMEEKTTETTPEESMQAPKTKSKTGGRRAALRILRESVDDLGKDLSSFRKNHEVSSKKLEKQVASLRSEVAALKSHITKEGVHARAKQEALLTKILAKVNAPKAAAAPKKKAKKKGSK